MKICKICKKYFDESYFFTLISYDDYGNLIHNYICKDCVKDENKLNQLLDIADVELHKERNSYLNYYKNL
jgi:hypothetical protein